MSAINQNNSVQTQVWPKINLTTGNELTLRIISIKQSKLLYAF